jgi:hypothetical protein
MIAALTLMIVVCRYATRQPSKQRSAGNVLVNCLIVTSSHVHISLSCNVPQCVSFLHHHIVPGRLVVSIAASSIRDRLIITLPDHRIVPSSHPLIGTAASSSHRRIATSPHRLILSSSRSGLIITSAHHHIVPLSLAASSIRGSPSRCISPHHRIVSSSHPFIMASPHHHIATLPHPLVIASSRYLIVSSASSHRLVRPHDAAWRWYLVLGCIVKSYHEVAPFAHRLGMRSALLNYPLLCLLHTTTTTTQR